MGTYRRGHIRLLAGWCVWLVGGDRASGLVLEGGLFAVAAGTDVVVVQQFVMARAEQNEVLELGLATQLVGDQVVCLELAGGAAAGVLAMEERLCSARCCA